MGSENQLWCHHCHSPLHCRFHRSIGPSSQCTSSNSHLLHMKRRRISKLRTSLQWWVISLRNSSYFTCNSFSCSYDDWVRLCTRLSISPNDHLMDLGHWCWDHLVDSSVFLTLAFPSLCSKMKTQLALPQKIFHSDTIWSVKLLQ